MPRQERSAGFVVYRVTPSGPEYLVLDYGRHWDFPKGHLEGGENDRAAALRELHEETGIADVKVLPDFHQEITYFFRDRKKGLIRKTVAFFVGEVGPCDIVLSREHEAFEFLPFDQAIKRVTYPNARQILKLAHERIERRAAQSSDTMS